MPNLPYHPRYASGMNEIVPGFFVVPQNPVTNRAPSSAAPVAAKGIAELVEGAFVVPQNPITSYMTGSHQIMGKDPGAPGVMNGTKLGCCGGSCGGSSGCGCGGGMGDLNTSFASFSTFLTDETIPGVPNYLLYGGAALVGYFLLSGGQESRVSRGRRAYRAARSAYA